MDFSNKTTTNNVAIKIAKIIKTTIALIVPFLAIVSKLPISFGLSATIPVKIINEPPLPIPLAVILFPNQIKINVPQSIVNAHVILNSKELASEIPEADNNAEIPIAWPKPIKIVKYFVY